MIHHQYIMRLVMRKFFNHLAALIFTDNDYILMSGMSESLNTKGYSIAIAGKVFVFGHRCSLL